MATRPLNLVLLGDQTVEKLSSIQSLVRHSKTSPAARTFLQEATDLVQLNFDQLAKEDRAWNHGTHNLLGLAEDNIAEENPNGIIATLLMLVGRLGELIVYTEEDPSLLGSDDDPVHILAFCTGLLPGAAVAAAQDSSQLREIGKELISITFRMICQITAWMKLIEDTNDSWAHSVVGKTPEQVQPILDRFHEIERIPHSKRIAIGVVSSGWLTLMGAPSSVARLMQFSPELRDAPKVKTDTNGAVHTEFMPSIDVDMVLGDSHLLDMPITSKVKLLSPSSCEPYTHTTLRALLADIMVDIVHNILKISETAETCISKLAGKDPVLMTVAGPTSHLSAVQKILQNKNIKYSIRQHHPPASDRLTRGGSDLVAVVGMSGRFPGSETVEGFYEDLLQGKIQIEKIPKSRFDLDTYYDSTGERRNTTSTQYGSFLRRPGYFDHRLFNISPREALQMDPLQRLLLTTSYEALERAGYSRDATLATESSRIAVFYGQAAEDWSEVTNNEGIDLYYIPGMNRAFGPSRLSYHHKWGGGTYALDSACATSTTAIQLACSALKARECDTALAGGGSILVTPNLFSGLSRSGMISDTGGCRTFHDDADGYCRGEGIGVVVLKRLEDAISDNDNILGVIRGSARSYSSTSTSITHPSATSQARIYEEVLRQTNVIPNEIAYVEMHGTGTQAGDFEEMTSIINVLARDRSNDNPLIVGAVKANVAHGEGAAGITSLVKVLMMLRERRIPPQPGLPFKLNHNFPPLDRCGIRIAGLSGDAHSSLQPSPSARDGKVKCIVNSFDASGGNTSLVIEEPPKPAAKAINKLPCHVITLSGRSTTSLRGNRKRLLDYLSRYPDTKLADVAYTATARRMHEILRTAYVVKTTKELMNLLRDDIASNGKNDPKMKAPMTQIVFVFTGQGSQYAGMGRHLFNHNNDFKHLLGNYQQIAQHLGLPGFLHLVSDDNSDIMAESSVAVQLAIVALEVATAQFLSSLGIKPDLVLGHSLGEYSALCVSGVLSVSDALYLVGQRSSLMQDRLVKGQYSMLAVGKDPAYVQKALARDGLVNTAISCLNAPDVTVFSGPTGEVEHLKAVLGHENVRSTLLEVPYGFHSTHVDPILGDFETTACGIQFSAPRIPIVSTLSGQLVEAGQHGAFSASYLTRQARERVDFVGALETYKMQFGTSQTCWIEIGPDPVCLSLVRRTFDTSTNHFIPTMKSSEDNWITLSACLASLYRLGISINWTHYFKQHKASVSLIDLPTYFFDEKDFWTPYVEHVAPALPSQSIASPEPEPSLPAFSTTSLHRVEQEVIQEQTIIATFVTHTSEPEIYAAIRGHVVNEVHICSLSVFSDMAKTAAHYAFERLNPTKSVPLMSVTDVGLHQALVVSQKDPKQVVRTKVTYSAQESQATISFVSTTPGADVEHGKLVVSFEDNAAWFAQLSNTSFLVNTRVEALKESTTTGKAHQLLRSVFYKLFENLVQYSECYQGVQEAWIDTQCRDAVATLRMPDTASAGHFMYNPFWMDAALQLSGFLLNGGLKYAHDVACLATGFETWKLLEEFEANRVYTVYVCIQESDLPNTLTGAAYVYNDQGKLIQATLGIKFLRMKKLVMKTILDPGSARKSTQASGLQASKSYTANERRPKTAPIERIGLPRETVETSSLLEDSSSEADGTSGGTSTPASSVSDTGHPDLLGTLLQVVASESGYTLSDMAESTSFADLGMDSLMAITVVASFQKLTGKELPATFFLEHETIAQVTKAFQDEFESEHSSVPVHQPLQDKQLVPAQVEERLMPAPPPTNTSPIVSSLPSPMKQTPETVGLDRPSKIVLLQGSPSAKQKLFLFPDGSGSPSQYIQLPPLGKDVSVYGLESPYLRAPSEYLCGLDSITKAFIAAIRTVQSDGPYMLGGYSFGGLYAYEAARQLLTGSESVDKLFIFDMSVPGVCKTALKPTHDDLKDSGLIPTVGRQTLSQKDHLINTINSLSGSTLLAMPAGHQPNELILISSSAGLGAGKTSQLATWAQGERDLARGWERLAGKVTSHTIEAEHFALMRLPAVKKLGTICAAAVTDSQV